MLKRIVIVVFVLFIVGCSSKIKFDEEYYSCASVCEDKSFARQAQKSNSTELCLEISDENMRNICKDTLNYALANKEKDISFCNNIINKDTKEQCKVGILYKKSIDQKDPNLCSELEDSTECKNNVYEYLAVSELDGPSCNQISGEDKKNSCFLFIAANLAVKNNDITECETLKDESKKANCGDYYLYIMSSQDRKLCKKISSKSLQDSCTLDEPFSTELRSSIGIVSGSFLRLVSSSRPTWESNSDGTYTRKKEN